MTVQTEKLSCSGRAAHIRIRILELFVCQFICYIYFSFPESRLGSRYKHALCLCSYTFLLFFCLVFYSSAPL